MHVWLPLRNVADVLDDAVDGLNAQIARLWHEVEHAYDIRVALMLYLVKLEHRIQALEEAQKASEIDKEGGI